jgi:hypothetical protein
MANYPLSYYWHSDKRRHLPDVAPIMGSDIGPKLAQDWPVAWVATLGLSMVFFTIAPNQKFRIWKCDSRFKSIKNLSHVKILFTVLYENLCYESLNRFSRKAVRTP